MKRELLIKAWLEPDEDDYITHADLHVSSLQAIEYIEELEQLIDELEERISHLETTLDTVDAALGRWRVNHDSD